jgi:flagellar hook-associated protein 1
MAYGSLFSIGTSALQASQLALQTSGNNIANAATPGYSRQVVGLSSSRPNNMGRYQVGTGVRVSDIRRMVDEQLLSRLRRAVSDEAHAGNLALGLSQVESLVNELTGTDLSTELGKFFGAWSERANLTKTSAIVVQQGEQLAGFIGQMRRDLSTLENQDDSQLGALVARVNSLLSQLHKANTGVVDSESMGGTAAGLRDQRDAILRDIAELVDISTIEQPNGGIDVFVGSVPIMLNNEPKPLALVKESGGSSGGTRVSIAAGNGKDCEQRLDITSGRLAAALASRNEAVSLTIKKLDRLAATLIFEVNKVHGTGANLAKLKSTLATLSVDDADLARALNDPASATLGELPFKPVNGGFDLTVFNPALNTSKTVRIDLDLDGINNAGLPGFADDTSLQDLQAAIDAIDGVKATIEADQGHEFAFSNDSSGVVGVLGLNAFFTGNDASNIAVSQRLKSNPSELSVGAMVNGKLVENAAALAISGLQDKALESQGGLSLSASWLDTVQGLGGLADQAVNRAESASIIRENIDAQVAGISGVSIDEEAINLMGYQRLYQAAARYIQTIDEITQTLISIV